VGNSIYRTTNGGANWTPQANPANHFLWGVSFVDADTGWAVGNFGTILHTTTGGRGPSTSSPANTFDRGL
jgi:photosystem II stability/assembly factor-like uncharacterized protein